MSNILLNGQVVPESTFCLALSNRSFRYGDGVFESINVANRYPLFFRSHYSRFVRGLDALGMEVPGDFSFMYFFRALMQLIEAENINNGNLRISGYRAGEGKYTPERNDFEWVATISARADDLTFYPLNEKGLHLGVYEAHKKPVTAFSSLKTNNAILPVLAGQYVKDSVFDDAILLNTSGNIAETVSSNLFYYKAGKIVTPFISDGGLDGILRSVVKKLAIWNKIDFEEKTISLEELEEAEEIFVSNVSTGIRWVGTYRGKSYDNAFTKGLHLKLNERVSKILESR